MRRLKSISTCFAFWRQISATRPPCGSSEQAPRGRRHAVAPSRAIAPCAFECTPLGGGRAEPKAASTRAEKSWNCVRVHVSFFAIARALATGRDMVFGGQIGWRVMCMRKPLHAQTAHTRELAARDRCARARVAGYTASAAQPEVIMRCLHFITSTFTSMLRTHHARENKIVRAYTSRTIVQKRSRVRQGGRSRSAPPPTPCCARMPRSPCRTRLRFEISRAKCMRSLNPGQSRAP